MSTVSKNDINVRVGQNIKTKMCFRTLAAKELATLAGVSYSTVSDSIQGRKMPSVKTLEKIAKVLGCSMSQLFEEEAR